jgi:polyisoprenoid-binding protein YceI
MSDIPFPNYLPGTWRADPAQSAIGFSVRLLMVGKARGRFTGFDVTIVTNEDPLASTVTASIDLASIDTDQPKRDKHLRSTDFLAVEQHPTMTYRSTGIRPVGDGWVVDGDLTLHDVTRPVTLTVAVDRSGVDRAGGRRVRLAATTLIKRGDFGIDRWIGGGAMVGNKVPISLAVEAVHQN